MKKRHSIILFAAALSLVFAAALATHLGIWLATSRLDVGEVVARPGRYRSPGGTWVVWAKLRGKAELVLTMEREGGGSARVRTPLPYGARWLVCWDEFDRLWTYMPGPGNGVQCWIFTEKQTDCRPVRSAAEASGIPDTFSKCLPRSVRTNLRPAPTASNRTSGEPTAGPAEDAAGP